VNIITLTQAQKQHDLNALHDAFVAAQIAPQWAEMSTDGLTSTFAFLDSVNNTTIQTVISSYSFVARQAPAQLRDLWQAYKSAVANASTVAQLKNAMTNELGAVLKELGRHIDGQLS
jgi:hypothetical protein